MECGSTACHSATIAPTNQCQQQLRPPGRCPPPFTRLPWVQHPLPIRCREAITYIPRWRHWLFSIGLHLNKEGILLLLLLGEFKPVVTHVHVVRCSTIWPNASAGSVTQNADCPFQCPFGGNHVGLSVIKGPWGMLCTIHTAEESSNISTPFACAKS